MTTAEDASRDPEVSGAAKAMGIAAKAGPFGAALVEAGRDRGEIVALSADLKKYTDLAAFAEEFPDRYVEVGMAEQNMIAVAGGLAASGLTVVAATFASFLTRRAHDFTIMQVALPKADVKLIGSVPGISSTFGPSHTAIDDLATMRAVPGMIVIDPADPVETAQALKVALEHDGPVYLRQPFNRPSSARSGRVDLPGFELGKAAIIRNGTDVAIIAGGDRLTDALEASDCLAADGIDATVVRSSTVKPFDADTVAEVAARHRVLVTIENHSVYGGLFSAVSEVIVLRRVACHVVPLGVREEFPPFGSPAYVAARLGMNADTLVRVAKQALDTA
jgi:transketolase